jgi:hypothetical protein
MNNLQKNLIARRAQLSAWYRPDWSKMAEMDVAQLRIELAHFKDQQANAYRSLGTNSQVQALIAVRTCQAHIDSKNGTS